MPTANQLVPPLLEYCHTPCVPALAVLPTTAMPPKLAPASMSANCPLKIVLIDCPAGLAVSSLTAASAPLPSVGASLTALTLASITSVALLNAVVPPLLAVLTLVPAVPLVWSQARSVSAAVLLPL